MIADQPSRFTPSALLGTAGRRGWIDGLIRWTRSWSFVGVLVLVYVMMGLRALSDDRYLDDEGLLTHLYAEFLRRDFAATFFWLKVHPALAILNLPGTVLGLGGFFVLHVFIGAIGIVFIAIAARRADIREVGLAPLVLATSPLYVQGGASGIGNVDGVAVASGALALYLAPSPGLMAGLVAGVQPLVRFELGLLTLTLAIMALAAGGQWRFLCGLACAPLIYLGVGSIYHGTPAWFVQFPPAWGHWDPTTFTVVAEGVQLITAGKLVLSLGLAIPALPLLLVRRGDHAARRPFDVGLLIYLMVFLAAITLLPFARVAFGFHERYYLMGLPAVALLAARAADFFGTAHPRRSGRLVRITIAVACSAGAAWHGAWGFAAMSLATTVILAAGPRLAAAPAVAAAATLMFVVVGVTLPRGYRRHDELQMVTAWLRDRRAEFGHVPIYTNLKLLHAFASRSGHAPGFDIVGLIQPDMRRELFEWSNPANGQQQRIWQLAHEVFYGRGADPADIVDGRAPPGALLVLLADDIRTNEMFSPTFLRAWTRTLATSPQLLIAVLLPQAGDRPGNEAPPSPHGAP